MRNGDLARLLPPKSTSLERSILGAAESVEQPTGPLPRLYRPDAVDTALLPWLAWSVDVLAWPRNADETARRNLVAGSWQLHRQQGTLAGYKTIAGYVGAEVVKAVTPPAKVFASASLSAVERNAFVARYPQLRIYPQRLTGHRVGALLANLHPGAAVYPVQTDAALRLAPQAYLYRDGSETALQAIERQLVTSEATAQQVTEIRHPGQAGQVGFCGRPVPWLATSDARQRMYRLSSDMPYLHQSERLRMEILQPGLDTLTVRYDWIAGPGQEHGVHAGRFVALHLMPSTARERIYKRYWLFDPAIDVSRQSACLHVGVGRLGMPPHHAEMQVRIVGKSPALAVRRHITGHLCRSDQSRLIDTLAAMRQIMRASDRIDIDTAVIRPVIAGDTLAGAIPAGQWH